MLAGIISGALQTSFFPVYAQVNRQHGPAAAKRVIQVLFWCLFGIGGVISLTLFLSSASIGSVLATEASPEARDATVYVLRFSAFAVVLNAIGDFLGFVLAVQNRYIVAAAAPIVNALLGFFLLLFRPEWGLTNLSIGTVIGIFAQVAIVFRAVDMPIFLRAPTSLPDGVLRTQLFEILRLGAWMLPGVIFANLSNALPQILITPFGDGAVSSFGYAFRFHQSAIQLLVMASSPVILARFSELAANGDWTGLRILQRKALAYAIAGGAAMFFLVWSLGEKLLDVVLGYGQFDSGAAERVSEHWFWLSLGIGAVLYGIVLTKRIQATKGAAALSVIAVIGTSTLVLVALILRRWLDEVSVTIALSASFFATVASMAIYVRRSSFGTKT